MQTNGSARTPATDPKTYAYELGLRLNDETADAGTLRETLAEAHAQRTIRRWWIQREINEAVRRLANLTGSHPIEVRAQAERDAELLAEREWQSADAKIGNGRP